MKSPIALLSSLLNDYSRLNPDVKGLERDLITFESRFENEGYGFLTVALPALDEALVKGLSSGKFTCPPHFKTVRGGAIPRFFSGMLCEVFEPFSGNLKEDVDFGVLKSLREIFRLFKKVQLTSREEKILHDKAVAGFFSCDEEAGRVIIPSQLTHAIEKVASFVLWPLVSKEPSLGTYKHGPGAVLEGYSANQKWRALCNSVRNAEFHLGKYGYDLFEVSLTDLSDRIIEAESTDQVPSIDGASSSMARLISVPKSTTSRRTITVEPLLNQFRQQGLNTILRDSINECGVLSICLDLADQSKNQKLALEGSLHDNWATIDLSSASDLLSVKLVETIFRHQRSFFDLMMDCRSVGVTSGDKSLASLNKFAGMGNALTFPVQSISFAVVCIAAILNARGESPGHWNVRRAARCIRVYGDDIIIKTQYAHQCVNWLQLAGLKVNQSKSFLTGNFKESCGVDAFRGVDITPLYLQHRPDSREASPKLIENFVSLSNQAWMRGLYEFSNALKDTVESLLRKRLPLVSSRSGVLGWHSRLDAMTPHKWCRNTQQFLTRSVASVPLKRKDRLDGWPALLKFFHVPLLGRDKNHLESTQIRYKSRIVPRWVPTYIT